ncbi:MAG: YbaB/EbfC family nucleoid-associated protein [Planctomycetes bacterium]|nr:YbaB/EbfC family nucleoid-associated protein [Planctomycetota bacterium]
MSGTFGEMGNLLKQAQQMQRELDRVRDELTRQRVEGASPNGSVRVEVSGDGMIQKVQIKPEFARSGDAAQIEEALLVALREGLQNAARLRAEQMSKVTGGLNLPGLL